MRILINLVGALVLGTVLGILFAVIFPNSLFVKILIMLSGAIGVMLMGMSLMKFSKDHE